MHLITPGGQDGIWCGGLIYAKYRYGVYVVISAIILFATITCGRPESDSTDSESLASFSPLDQTPWVGGNTPPKVNIASPTSKTSFTAPANITIDANASDIDGQIMKVEFFNAGSKIGEDTTPPYSMTMNNMGAGTYALMAKATDNESAVTDSASVVITVNGPPNVGPQVSISSPLNNAIFMAPASIPINVNATDSDGAVVRVEFFNGATKLGEDLTAPFSLVLSNVAASTLVLTAKATDNSGASTTSAPINAVVNNPPPPPPNNVPPTVTITAPLANTAFTAPANITISANAADTDGTITKVEFFNGATKLGEDLTAPYSMDITNVAASSLSLTARATDSGGATTNSAAINVVVNNPPNVAPVVSISSPANNATFPAPATVAINATATDSDGTITKVEFFNGATKLGEDLVAPYSFVMSNVAASTLVLTAKAIDNSNASTTSVAVNVTVTAPAPVPAVTFKDILQGLPKGAASFTALCQTAGADRFTTTFCAANRPNVTSLAQLHTALGLTNAANSACTTNSVSLVKTETSVLNPRCIKFSTNGQDASATAVGYLRAEMTFAEVVARDPNTGILRFFLVDFDLPCELTPQGCTKADFYLPAAEANWAAVSVYEDTQLRNTVLDCRMCHQPGGPNGVKALRMAETDNPWRHWFRDNRVCGTTLLDDFNAAHNGETNYAALTLAQISNSDPARLERFVEDNGFQGATFGNNFFNSGNIEQETDVTAGHPQSNANTTTSNTWTNAFNQRSALQNLTAFGGVMMPYRDCKQSDPVKLPQFTNLYRQVRAGQQPASAMPSLPEVNLSTTQALRDRAMLPRASTTARTILTNACMSCHNNNLDQTISRARFNAQDLARNASVEYDVAINRISRVAEDLRRMPPKTFMNLTADEIQLLTTFFQQEKAAAIAAGR